MSTSTSIRTDVRRAYFFPGKVADVENPHIIDRVTVVIHPPQHQQLLIHRAPPQTTPLPACTHGEVWRWTGQPGVPPSCPHRGRRQRGGGEEDTIGVNQGAHHVKRAFGGPGALRGAWENHTTPMLQRQENNELRTSTINISQCLK